MAPNGISIHAARVTFGADKLGGLPLDILATTVLAAVLVDATASINIVKASRDDRLVGNIIAKPALEKGEQ